MIGVYAFNGRALILALNDSVFAFVALFTKKLSYGLIMIFKRVNHCVEIVHS